MLPSGFIVVAILLRFVAGASYLKATWQGRAKPSLVSWGLWSVTALIAFCVQMVRSPGPEAWVTLAIGLSPLAVCVAAIVKHGAHRTKLTPLDKWCAALAALGIVLWVVSRNPLIALLLSIAAEFISDIPTIVKSYRAPHTEHALTYFMSALSMAITLLTITTWQLTNWLFIAAILAVNITIALTIVLFSRIQLSWRTPPAYDTTKI